MSRKNRKRKQGTDDPIVIDVEQDNFFTDGIKKEIETMWEIPQIFQFLYLTRESLNIPQFSIYEIERMLLIPRASKQLANIMTCLLSSPITKAKLRKVPPMPYEFWTNILAHKMTSWFKVYHTKHKDSTKILETIGVEPEFWNIFPDASLLDGKDFENLSFKQRVWLLKTVCDTIMHTRKTVQEDLGKQPWEDLFETILGFDRDGTRYIYFPQFISSDLRIYRHCVDNKILSTVKPVRLKQDVADVATSSLIGTKLNKYRTKKSQSHDDSSERSDSYKNIDEKDFNNYKCNNDSATCSIISEDTNMSSASICSNNNNISLDAINRKRCRSSSKTSEESALSNTKSSGYDTNTSSDNKFLNDMSQNTFKGFSNTSDNNCNIEIINEMLDNLRSKIDQEKSNKCSNKNSDSNGKTMAEENFVGSYKNTADSCGSETLAERNESEKSFDNLSSSSKTDDEKLNEIISAENCKLSENVCSKSISTSISNLDDNISTSTSKSDDEKLSETKSNDSNNSAVDEKDNLIRDITFNGKFSASSSDNTFLNEKVVEPEYLSKDKDFSSAVQERLNDSIQERSSNDRPKLRSHYRAIQHNDKTDYETKQIKKEAIKEKIKKLEFEDNDMDDKTFFTSEAQAAMEQDLDDCTNNVDTGYNLRSCKQPQTDEYKQHFNSMLSDLSVSDFQLVVDSVEGLRNLISNFSASNSNVSNTDVKVTPLCEVKLVKKLTDLLNSLEATETTLKDTARKAKLKLQREWSNFKEGLSHDEYNYYRWLTDWSRVNI